MGRLWSTGTLRSAAESQECADARESTPATTATKLAHVHPEISRALKMHQPGGTKHRPHQIGVVVPPAVPPISPGWMGASRHPIGHQSLIYQRKRAFAEFQRTPLDGVMVGWRLLNEACQPAWMLGFRNSVFSLYPRLYPHPCLATYQTGVGTG